MRPSSLFIFLVLFLCVAAFSLSVHARQRFIQQMAVGPTLHSLTRELGITDLCLTTEARYTRHPAVSDDLAPFMDYPASLEHFPSGLFLAPK